MAIILPRITENEQIGTALGTGLSSLLGGLAQGKIEGLQRQQQATGLQSIGFSPEEAQQLSGLDPALISTIAKEKIQAPSRQAFTSSLQSLLGVPQQDQESDEPTIVPTGLKPEQALKLTELGLKQKEAGEKIKIEQIKLTKDELKEFRKRSKTAKEDIENLNRLEEIEKAGELDSTAFSVFLEESGLDVAALRSPGSQEYNKIVNNFVRNIKDIFGARISNQEMEQFMKTLPNLTQSPQGRKRIISNLKRVARVNSEYGKVAREILRENKGIPPLDIMDQVEDRMDKRLDKFAKMFKADIKKEVPTSEDTALGKAGILAAKTLGKAFPVAAKTGAGAVLGSVIPGLGTALGAGIGAGAGLAGIGKTFLKSIFSS